MDFLLINYLFIYLELSNPRGKGGLNLPEKTLPEEIGALGSINKKNTCLGGGGIFLDTGGRNICQEIWGGGCWVHITCHRKMVKWGGRRG